MPRRYVIACDDPPVSSGGEPYHPRADKARRQRSLLNIPDATAMAVGGMIGGGIFSVLGVAITLAGHLAFGCFVIGALISAITARSFAGVMVGSRGGSGPFAHLREQGRPQIAGTLLWLLVFGYMVAMAVYSFTFGRYAADAFHASTSVARLLSIAVVALFLAINLRGVRLSSLTEDLVVMTKLVILFGIAFIGVAQLDTGRLAPLTNRGIGGSSSVLRPSSSPTRVLSSSVTTATTCSIPTGPCPCRCTCPWRSSRSRTSRSQSERRCSRPTV